MNKKYEQYAAQEIRAQYMEKGNSELDTLRALDARVKRPANVFAYVFGTVGSLVLGMGMCLAMKIIGDAMIPGILIGCVGIAMVSCTYVLYKKLLAKRRAKYKDQVNALSEKILANEEN